MSIQLAKNETVVRKFDYATLGYRKKTDSYAVSRSLIVTNKRVIHQDVSEQAGRDLIVRREMPIEHAKFVDVRYAKTSKPGRLIAALIFAILAVVSCLLTNLKAAFESIELLQKIAGPLFYGLAGLFALIALINVIAYFTSRRIYLACTVSTDSLIQSVISNTITDESISPKKAKQARKKTLHMEVDISIDKKAAKALADGLGAAILDAIDMNREAEEGSVATEMPVACNSEVPAFAIDAVQEPDATPDLMTTSASTCELSSEENADENDVAEETAEDAPNTEDFPPEDDTSDESKTPFF